MNDNLLSSRESCKETYGFFFLSLLIIIHLWETKNIQKPTCPTPAAETPPSSHPFSKMTFEKNFVRKKNIGGLPVWKESGYTAGCVTKSTIAWAWMCDVRPGRCVVRRVLPVWELIVDCPVLIPQRNRRNLSKDAWGGQSTDVAHWFSC